MGHNSAHTQTGKHCIGSTTLSSSSLDPKRASFLNCNSKFLIEDFKGGVRGEINPVEAGMSSEHIREE